MPRGRNNLRTIRIDLEVWDQLDDWLKTQQLTMSRNHAVGLLVWAAGRDLIDLARLQRARDWAVEQKRRADSRRLA